MSADPLRDWLRAVGDNPVAGALLATFAAALLFVVVMALAS